jgi:general secretion pathway protein C
MKRLPKIASFALFIALCVSAAYWGMQMFNPPLRDVSAPPRTEQAIPRVDAAAILFGGHPNAVVASNFQLNGVVVASNPTESVAILSANGKSARAIRINTEVLPGVVVKEVQHRYVLLSDGGVIKRVELSADPARMKTGISGNVTGPSAPPAKQQPANIPKRGAISPLSRFQQAGR